MEKRLPRAEDWKWATVFIEIALRAIRRVHYEYGMWGIGRQWEMNRLKARRINMGHGIELADERTVCAAITQEFISSPSLTGLWVEESKDTNKGSEERYFTIAREHNYGNGNERVDIFVQKYKRENGQLISVPEPSFIEAKRARIWVPEIIDGTARREPLQVDEVRKDIEKLRQLLANSDAKIHCHLLVWGIYQDGCPEDSPVSFFDRFDKCVVVHQLRWLPLQWTSPSSEDIGSRNVYSPIVERALWVALAEVFENENEMLALN